MRKKLSLYFMILSLFLSGCSGMLRMSEKEIQLTPGENYQLSISSKNVEWTSDDESIARVSQDGVVTAEQTGDCRIIAKSGFFSASTHVIVIASAVELSRKWPLDHTFYLHEDDIMTCRLTSKDDVRWFSSNEATTAIVPSADTKTCDVIAKKKGSTMIIAESASETIVWNIHVVKNNPRLNSDVETYIYDSILRHKPVITFKYNQKLTKNDFNKILRSSEFALSDYNYLSLTQWEASYSQLGNDFSYTLKLDYGVSKELENVFEAMFTQVMLDLHLDDLSDYAKIKKIQTYILDHVTYDNDTVTGKAKRYYAYNALCEGKSVCQGYAALFYCMCRWAHIDCRVMIGNAEGGRHAWNIVRLGKKYYYVDPTWDDQGDPNRYFLKGAQTFEREHEADSFYQTKDFTETYPIAQKDYKGKKK